MNATPPEPIHIEVEHRECRALVVVNGHFVVIVEHTDIDKEHRRGPHHDPKHDPDHDGDSDEPSSLLPPYPTSADPDGMADQTK